MNNVDIRNEIERAGVRYWQVANALGMTDGTFSRKLRHELSEPEKARVLKVIAALQKGAR